MKIFHLTKRVVSNIHYAYNPEQNPRMVPYRRRTLCAVCIVCGLATASVIKFSFVSQAEEQVSGISSILTTPLAIAPVTDEKLITPNPSDWPMFRRTYDGWGYSPLTHINTNNVQQIKLAWVWAMEEGRNQPTPLVHDGVMFLANPQGIIQALNARSGDRLWETNEPTSRTDRPAKHGTAFLIRQPTPNDPFRVWLFSETGDLILARLTRDAYEELGRTHLLEPTNECFGRPVVWSHPAFANGCCFVRNDEELICVSLLAKDTDD